MVHKLNNNSLSTKKINTVENIWKSKEEITQIRPVFSLIFSQNTGLYEKYVQTLVTRTFSHFKTPRSSLQNTRPHLVFSTPLDIWESEEVVLLVFELLEYLTFYM